MPDVRAVLHIVQYFMTKIEERLVDMSLLHCHTTTIFFLFLDMCNLLIKEIIIHDDFWGLFCRRCSEHVDVVHGWIYKYLYIFKESESGEISERARADRRTTRSCIHMQRRYDINMLQFWRNYISNPVSWHYAVNWNLSQRVALIFQSRSCQLLFIHGTAAHARKCVRLGSLHMWCEFTIEWIQRSLKQLRA